MESQNPIYKLDFEVDKRFSDKSKKLDMKKVVIIGSSGTGKSTLCNILSGKYHRIPQEAKNYKLIFRM